MLKPFILRLHPAVHVVVAMADRNRKDSPEKIKILVTFDIPNPLIFSMRHNERFAEVMKKRGKQKLPIGNQNLLLGHLRHGDTARTSIAHRREDSFPWR
jgi:hypothetical protein